MMAAAGENFQNDVFLHVPHHKNINSIIILLSRKENIFSRIF